MKDKIDITTYETPATPAIGETAIMIEPIRLSADLKKAVHEGMEVIEQFTGILNRETDALRRADTATVGVLYEEKMLLAQAYQSVYSQLKMRRDELRTLDMATKTKLDKIGTKFQRAANANVRALNNMKKSTTRLVERIMQFARQAVNEEPKGYGRNGRVINNERVSAPIRLNETL